MIAFVAIAALLALIVLLIVLRPLWRGAPNSTAALGGFLLLTGAALYFLLGTPAALDATIHRGPVTLQDAVTQLESALQRDPSQAEGWRLLGRAYESNHQPVKSRDAYAHAATLSPNQPDVLVEAAEASALADPQRRFDAKAVALLEHALQLQPQEQRARWFLGIAQRQADKPAEAAKTWEPLLSLVDAKTAVPLRAQIDAARSEAGLPPLPPPLPLAVTHGLQVKVALDPQLAARVRLRGDASVFVIARVPNGPPMPVAVEKHSVQELPFTATLDDSDGPMPTRKLSAMQDVEVIARLSMSGNPIPQPGDLESPPLHVHLPIDQAVNLTIGAMHR
jgi:cytochrome c-type biogenesis protein CcmH